MKTWRDIARPIIREVLAKKLEPKEERKALREAYPFGIREHWPYKVWLDEIQRQRGIKPPLGSRARPIEIPNPNQAEIWQT